MEEIHFEVKLRKEKGSPKARSLRREKQVPGVIYGKGINQSVAIDRSQFQRLIASRSAESMLIHLKIVDETGKEKKVKDHPVIIKDIQYDPVKDDVIHVDFNEVSLTKKLKVKVPVVAKGDAEGVKKDGGVLEHPMWEVEVECLPINIPEKIEVDVSAMKIGDSVHVKDLKTGEGVKILDDPEQTVIAIAAPEKLEAAPAEEALAGEEASKEPEVIKKKKEEAEEEAEEEPKAKEEKK